MNVITGWRIGGDSHSVACWSGEERCRFFFWTICDPHRSLTPIRKWRFRYWVCPPICQTGGWTLEIFHRILYRKGILQELFFSARKGIDVSISILMHEIRVSANSQHRWWSSSNKTPKDVDKATRLCGASSTTLKPPSALGGDVMIDCLLFPTAPSRASGLHWPLQKLYFPIIYCLHFPSSQDQPAISSRLWPPIPGQKPSQLVT